MTTYQCRPYQKSAIDTACNTIKYNMGHGYIKAPGGSGKSVMIAKVAEWCFDNQKTVTILARNEKLLRQNRGKFAAPYQEHIGYYCAGLGEKDLAKPITVASIQSIARHENPPHMDVLLVDECQNIPPESQEEAQYWQYINKVNNPQIIGFTATDFRTGSGVIQWGRKLYDIPIKPLFDAGYIIKPTNKVGAHPDLSKVQVRMGEYVESQLESIFVEPEMLELSIKQIKAYGADRHSVLIFCQSRRHAAIVSECLEEGIVVDGNTPKPQLDIILNDFENRRFKYLINCQLLTEGYDAPNIDMVVILRSTVSKGLFEQMVYRGTRLYPEKTDFFLLDMGGNLERHGPLGSPYMGKQGQEGKANTYKVCPECEELTPITKKECAECGYEFIKDEAPKHSHDLFGDIHSETVFDASQYIKWHDVDTVMYAKHTSKTDNISIRVDYFCADIKYGKISEWIAVCSDNAWAKGNCEKFFEERGGVYFQDWQERGLEIDDLLRECEALTKPKKIQVDTSEKYARVKQYVFTSEPIIEDEIPW